MRKLAIPLVLTVILSIPAVMLVRSIQWLAPAASLEADTSDYLILLTFDIATVVFVLCTVFLVYALIVFRRRPGDLGDGQHFHSHNALEIGWTVVPTIIVLGLWWLGVVEMRKTNFSAVMAGEMPEGALHVKVTGQQWAWSFEYPGLVDNPSLGELRSDELVLPVGRPVFFDIMSTDVIHSFWVPEMRFKMDAIPGRTNHVVYNPSVIGEYKVRCAEICGTDHAAMRAPVRVVSAEDFDAFVADNDISNLSPAARGERWSKVYGCVACHSPVGEQLVGPTWQNLYGHEAELEDGSTVLADDDYIRNSILAPGSQIVKGYQNVMPANFEDRFTADFGSADTPVQDLIEYMKTLNAEN